MEVLAALFETEKELTDSRFRQERGRDVSCLVSFHHCGRLNNEKLNTNNRKRCICWQFMSTPEDLDYADDLSLISSNYSNIQEKTTTE